MRRWVGSQICIQDIYFSVVNESNIAFREQFQDVLKLRSKINAFQKKKNTMLEAEKDLQIFSNMWKRKMSIGRRQALFNSIYNRSQNPLFVIIKSYRLTQDLRSRRQCSDNWAIQTIRTWYNSLTCWYHQYCKHA